MSNKQLRRHLTSGSHWGDARGKLQSLSLSFRWCPTDTRWAEASGKAPMRHEGILLWQTTQQPKPASTLKSFLSPFAFRYIHARKSFPKDSAFPKHNLHPSPPQAPRILLANCTSFCIIVTLFACMAQRFVSSKRCTMNASAASCSACIACDCHRRDSPPRGTRDNPISRT